MAQALAFIVSAFQAVNELWKMVSLIKRDVAALARWIAVVSLQKDYRKNYATARFTPVGSKVLSKFFNTSDIQNLHWDINCWGDEEVKAWKNNCISGYGAVAVAVRRRIWTQYFISV
jgi:hypothetical protein